MLCEYAMPQIRSYTLSHIACVVSLRIMIIMPLSLQAEKAEKDAPDDATTDPQPQPKKKSLLGMLSFTKLDLGYFSNNANKFGWVSSIFGAKNHLFGPVALALLKLLLTYISLTEKLKSRWYHLLTLIPLWDVIKKKIPA